MSTQPVIANLTKFVALPIAFYALCFFALTFPLFTRFSTHLFSDTGDGLQNIWNLWWVNRATTELYQSPWHTELLHHPAGISLRGHSLTPFNGYLAIPMLKVMPLIQVHNLIVIFTFITSGLTAFWLAYRLIRAYMPALIAGYIFTFSNYHFAHAQGHLNLISLEWIPLFLLCWYELMTRPRVSIAIAAALVQYANLLCEYNFFFFCALAGMIMFVWNAVRLRSALFALKRPHILPLVVFAVVTIFTSGLLIGPLLLLNHRDPLAGSHDPAAAGTDLLAPLIPGGCWRFHRLTQAYWSRLNCENPVESSVHLGFSVVALLAYGWFNRKRMRVEALGLWYTLLIGVLVLSFGPKLHAWGEPVPFAGFLPYAWMEVIFPPIRVASMPVRLMVIPTLCAAIVSAGALQLLFSGRAVSRALAVVLFVGIVVESLPRPIPASVLWIPTYVRTLKDLPNDGGVLDAAWVRVEDLAAMSDDDALWKIYSRTEAMYHQTIHEKPIAFGYVARVPESVYEQDLAIVQLLKRRRLDLLWPKYGIRYLVLRDGHPPLALPSACLLLDGEFKIYDLSGKEGPPTRRPAD